MGAIAFITTGTVLYNPLSSSDGSLASYYEWDTLDPCYGHSSVDKQYHYHAVRIFLNLFVCSRWFNVLKYVASSLKVNSSNFNFNSCNCILVLIVDTFQNCLVKNILSENVSTNNFIILELLTCLLNNKIIKKQMCSLGKIWTQTNRLLVFQTWKSIVTSLLNKFKVSGYCITGASTASPKTQIGYAVDGYPVYGYASDSSGNTLKSCYTTTSSKPSNFTDFSYNTTGYAAGTCHLDQANGYTFSDGTYGYVMVSTNFYVPYYYSGTKVARICGFTPSS